VPRRCIPGQIDGAATTILLTQEIRHLDHLVRILLTEIETGDLSFGKAPDLSGIIKKQRKEVIQMAMQKKEMFSDPEPLDEDDPEAMEEIFEMYNDSGLVPEDLTNATDERRKEYAEYLQKETLV
jgi:hypothetical protein